MKKDSLFM